MPPIIDDIDRGQVVPPGALKVVGVVRGRDFDGARAKGHVAHVVGDDDEAAVGEEGVEGAAADQVRVPRVARVHGDGHVAEHGLRASGGDDDLFAALLAAVRRALGEAIGERGEGAELDFVGVAGHGEQRSALQWHLGEISSEWSRANKRMKVIFCSLKNDIFQHGVIFLIFQAPMLGGRRGKKLRKKI